MKVFLRGLNKAVICDSCREVIPSKTKLFKKRKDRYLCPSCVAKIREKRSAPKTFLHWFLGKLMKHGE